jgi:uncharacterized protein (DUF486 family)
MKAITTIGLLILANIFIFLAWYGTLKFKDYKFFENKGMIFTILIAWLIVFFVCVFQIPANKIGFIGNNGPFTLLQLKVIQEVIGVIVFVILMLLFFKDESFRWNHVIGFIFLILAVYFMFKK